MQWLDNYGDNVYDGYAVKQWLHENVDIAIYISALYLAFVFKGPDLVQYVFKGKQNVALIKKMWMVWNIGLTVFSFYGSVRVIPVMISNLQKYGLRDSLCTFREDQFYTTRVGFAMGLFCISKLPEFGDTFFLILSGKRDLPFLQWFHHVTIFLYCWLAYQQASPIMIIIATMNYPIHTIMYFYFALAEGGFRDKVRPYGMYITILQIMQMVIGLTSTCYVLFLKDSDAAAGLAKGALGTCAGPTRAVVRGQIGIYGANLIMFTRMFLQQNVWNKERCASPVTATAPRAEKPKKN